MQGIPLSPQEIEAMVRSVSENGDFVLARAELSKASGLLNAEQSIRLYEHIRDNAERFEFEWRNEFVQAFPGSEQLLPRPLW